MNEKIRVPEVRLIGPDGGQLGVMSIDKARGMANQFGLDLVEVAAQASPPVCRIIDFSKFKYEEEKKEREAKKHHKSGHLKEIRLKPNIDEHDYQVKLKQTINFLKKKDRVKVGLFFKGRQIEHIDLGRKVLDRFIADIQLDGQLEKEPGQEGKAIFLVIA
ncbi:MAG: translation initiation factor IF-3, partial [Candidatus Omnitrophica bacterium]|nr:translation initiation factor IF-3 [Candidatus Omnitrophota bacterium]